ncbi:MAG: DNA cytosine methyltransferase [Olsenella sp.]
MRYISVFSGIEAASVAWQPLGWEPLAFSEIDPFPSAVLAARFPNVPNLGDITKIDWSAYAGAVDIVVGGSPCQSFSVAGKREGLAGASGLMFEYIRAVRELRPRFFVWENVPGALSSEDGAAFGQLLSEMDDLRYGVAWRVLDAEFFGVAQRRRRVFLVGCLGDPERAAEILFEPDGLRWDHQSSRDKRQELAGAAGAGAGCDSGDECLTPCGFSWHMGGNAGNIGCEPELSPTLGTAKEPAVCYAMRMREGKPGGGKGPLVQTDVSGTLATGNDQTIFQPICMADGNANTAIDFDMCGTLKVGGEPPIVLHVSNDTPMVLYDGLLWTVRRLMPIECERLQGFTDGWTDIPWRGKDHAPDGPRYKAIGNSMCVQVMRWIGERIADAAVACVAAR